MKGLIHNILHPSENDKIFIILFVLISIVNYIIIYVSSVFLLTIDNASLKIAYGLITTILTIILISIIYR